MLNLIKTFNRPLSPHLTVYSTQLTSIFSIWHRITGVILTTFLITTLIFLKTMSYKFFYGFPELHVNLDNWLINILFFNFLLFFIYHMTNGLRHIIWDLGYFFMFNWIQIFVKSVSLSVLVISLLLILKILS